MDKKRVERQEVMMNVGDLQKEMDELKKYDLPLTEDIEISAVFGQFLTVVCC